MGAVVVLPLITLAILAAAFLVATAPSKRKGGTDGGADTLIPLTSNEIRRRFGKLVLFGRTTVEHVMKWHNGADTPGTSES